jgi:hypothetical protein
MRDLLGHSPDPRFSRDQSIQRKINGISNVLNAAVKTIRTIC